MSGKLRYTLLCAHKFKLCISYISTYAVHLLLLIELLITVISAYLNFRQAYVALFYVLKTYILLFLLFGVLIAFLLNAKYMGA